MPDVVLREGALSGTRIAVLVESDFYEPEIFYYQHRFAEEGAEVDFLTRLWGNDSITFTPGSQTGVVVARLNGTVVAQFAPTGRLVAHGGAGNDVFTIGETSLFEFQPGNKVLIGGEGQDVEGRGGTGHAPAPPEARRVCAMAFGPGLTVESALLTRRVGG